MTIIKWFKIIRNEFEKWSKNASRKLMEARKQIEGIESRNAESEDWLTRKKFAENFTLKLMLCTS